MPHLVLTLVASAVALAYSPPSWAQTTFKYKAYVKDLLAGTSTPVAPPPDLPVVAPGDLVLTPASFDFGNTPVGSRSSKVFVLRNQSTSGGLATLAPAVTSGQGWSADSSACPTYLTAGSACNVLVQFNPSTVTTHTGTLQIATVDASTAVTANLLGQGVTAALTFSANPLVFPLTEVGQTSSSQVITITNVSSLAAPLHSITAGASFPKDLTNASNNTCSQAQTLSPGASCTLALAFKPTQSGAVTESLTVNSTLAYQVVLTGSASGGQITAAPSLVSEIVDIDTSQDTTQVGANSFDHNASLPYKKVTRTITLTNTGSKPLTELSLLLANPGTSGAPAISHACPTSLNVGQSCSITVSAYRHVAGAFTADLIVSAAHTAPYTIPLSIRVSATPTAPVLTSDTPSYYFGPIDINTQTPTKTVTYHLSANAPAGATATVAPGTIPAIAEVVNNLCATPLTPGQSCTIGYKLRPTTLGVSTATVPVTGTLALPAAAPSTIDLKSNLSVMGTGPELAITPNPLSFGLSPVNTTTVRTGILVNKGNRTAEGTPSWTTPFSALSLNPSPSCTNLAPGASCTWSAQLSSSSPVSLTGSQLSATVANSTATTPLTGQVVDQPILQLSANTLNFGKVALHSTPVSRQITVYNIGSLPADLSSLASTSPFQLTTSCASTLAPGQSCVSSYTLDTASAGSSLQGVSTYGQPPYAQTLSLSASVQTEAQNGDTASIVLSPTALRFPYTPIGQVSAPQTLTVSNLGASSMPLIPSLQGAAPSEFSLDASQCPTTLPSGSSCSLSVSATPRDTLLSNPQALLNPLSSDGAPTASISLDSNQIQGLAFGALPLDASNSRTNRTVARTFVRNTSTSSINATPSLTSGNFFSILSTSCATLAPGATCFIEVQAKTSQLGTFSDTIQAGSSSIGLSSTVIEPLSLTFNPTSASIPSSYKIPTSPLTISLVNNSSIDAPLASPSFINFYGAAFSSTCSTLLPAGDSCDITLLSSSRLPPSISSPTNSSYPWSTPLVVNTLDGMTQATALVSGSVLVPSFTVSPSSLTFGTVSTGQTVTRSATVTNTSTNAAVLKFSPVAAPAPYALDLTSSCLTTPTPAGQSCTLTYSFSPTNETTGTRLATLDHNALSSSPSQLSLSGIGLVSFDFSQAMSPSAWNILSTVNTPVTQQFTFTNTSTQAISLGNLTLSPGFAAQIQSNSCSSGSSLAPNATCSFTLAFSASAPVVNTSYNKTASLAITAPFSTSVSIDVPSLEIYAQNATLSAINTPYSSGTLDAMAVVGDTTALVGSNFMNSAANTAVYVNGQLASDLGWTATYVSPSQYSLQIPSDTSLASGAPSTYTIGIKNVNQQSPVATGTLSLYGGVPQLTSTAVACSPSTTPCATSNTSVVFNASTRTLSIYQPPGSTGAARITLAHPGAASSLPVDFRTTSPTPAAVAPFSYTSNCSTQNGGYLSGQASCYLDINFASPTSGASSYTLGSVAYNASNASMPPITVKAYPSAAFGSITSVVSPAANGHDPLSATTTLLDFGISDSNLARRTATVTVKNTSTTYNLYDFNPTIEGSSNFQIDSSATTCTSTILKNTSCTVALVYAPPGTSKAEETATLNLGFANNLQLSLKGVDGGYTTAGIALNEDDLYIPMYYDSATTGTVAYYAGSYSPFGLQVVSGGAPYVPFTRDASYRVFNPTLPHYALTTFKTVSGGTTGNSGMLYRPTLNSPLSGTGDFTISFWSADTGNTFNNAVVLTQHVNATAANYANPNGSRGVLAVRTSPNANFCLNMNTNITSGTISSVCTTRNIRLTSTNRLIQHVTFTRQGTTLKAYLNGELQGTTQAATVTDLDPYGGLAFGSNATCASTAATPAGTAPSCTDTLTSSNAYWASNSDTQRLTDVAFIKRALSDAEIQQIATRRAPLKARP